MRNPSLHITQSDLEKVLIDLDIPKKYAAIIVKMGRIYTPNNRKLIIDNKKMESKAKKVIGSTNYDSELFSKILLLCRRKLKHRGLTQIKQTSRDWLTVKEIVVIANEFCETFNLSKQKGYQLFIEIGLKKMAKFMLIKYINMGNSIIETYSAMIELDGDDNKSATNSLYELYRTQIMNKTGLLINYIDNPDKYVYFYKARLLAKELNIDYVNYIKAQFYALEWRNGYPDPIQLIGDKAVANLSKYLYENKIQIKNNEKKNGVIDWKKLKAMSDE